jgi:hypothetical protein
MELRAAWVQSVAAGKSFADVGPLWTTEHEMITTAAHAGARSATAIDIAPMDDPVRSPSLWERLRTHCAERGVTGYDEIEINLDDPALASRAGPYDVVYCSGVLYHVPNPVHTVMQLRSICSEYLILASQALPTRIENAAGTLNLEGGASLFVPALNDYQRRVVAVHLEALGVHLPHISKPGADEPFFENGILNYGPWWWLWSDAFLKSLLELCGFEIVQADMRLITASFLCRRLEFPTS